MLANDAAWQDQEIAHVPKKVQCMSQADDGYLYPLEKGFFYVHKPPTLLVYDEVESIEFMRQGAGVLSNSAKTFDLAVRMKHDQVSTVPDASRHGNMATQHLVIGLMQERDCHHVPQGSFSCLALQLLLSERQKCCTMSCAGTCVQGHPEGRVAQPVQFYQAEAVAH